MGKDFEDVGMKDERKAIGTLTELAEVRLVNDC